MANIRLYLLKNKSTFTLHFFKKTRPILYFSITYCIFFLFLGLNLSKSREIEILNASKRLPNPNVVEYEFA